MCIRDREKNITLSLCDTDLHVLCEPKWTEEALGNIVDNAIKYTACGLSLIHIFCLCAVSISARDVIGVNFLQRCFAASQFAWRTSRSMTVSYTHLDVYKRQGL